MSLINCTALHREVFGPLIYVIQNKVQQNRGSNCSHTVPSTQKGKFALFVPRLNLICGLSSRLSDNQTELLFYFTSLKLLHE